MLHKAIHDRARPGAVAAGIDRDEIGGRGQGGKSVFRSNCRDPLPARGNPSDHLPEVGLILQCSECGLGCKPVHAEMMADLVKGARVFRRRDRIADARAGQAISL